MHKVSLIQTKSLVNKKKNNKKKPNEKKRGCLFPKKKKNHIFTGVLRNLRNCSFSSHAPFICCMCEQREILNPNPPWSPQVHKWKEPIFFFFFNYYLYRHSSSNMWKRLPVKLSSHVAGHSGEAPPGDETWYLPQTQSVSMNTYR